MISSFDIYYYGLFSFWMRVGSLKGFIKCRAATMRSPKMASLSHESFTSSIYFHFLVRYLARRKIVPMLDIIMRYYLRAPEARGRKSEMTYHAAPSFNGRCIISHAWRRAYPSSISIAAWLKREKAQYRTIWCTLLSAGYMPDSRQSGHGREEIKLYMIQYHHTQAF